VRSGAHVVVNHRGPIRGSRIPEVLAEYQLDGAAIPEAAVPSIPQRARADRLRLLSII
jgi:hypothetical protein